MLAVMLIAGIVALMNSIPLSIRTIYGVTRFYTGMTPRGDAGLTPKIRQRIEQGAPVPIDRIMTVRVSEIQKVRSIVGPWPFIIGGLSEPDRAYYLKRIGSPAIEGRLPEDGKPEVLISEPLARNLGLKLGDVLLEPDEPKAFSPQEVRIVGIADSKEWFALATYQYYFENHFPPIDLLMVWAKNPKDQLKLDHWAYEEFKGENARVYAWFLVEKETQEMFEILYKILNVVIAILVVVITIMMGMLINIYQSQRVPEFGLLQALGFTRSRLLKRVLAETLTVVLGGWVLGTLAAFGLLNTIKAVLMDPNAFMLDTLDRTAYLYTVPVPVAIVTVAVVSLMLGFRKFDPIGVVERRLV